MPALDLALGLWMQRRAANVLDFMIVEPCRQIARDIGRAVVREQTRPMNDMGLIQAGCLERHIQRLGHVLSLRACKVVGSMYIFEG